MRVTLAFIVLTACYESFPFFPFNDITILFSQYDMFTKSNYINRRKNKLTIFDEPEMRDNNNKL